MPLEIKDIHHLRAAHGYVDLGMYMDAQVELEDIAHDCSTHPEVLAVRVGIHAGLKQWEQMQAMAKRLLASDPANPQWPISLAYATRRAQSIEDAKAILLAAVEIYPEEAMIRYNLACYESQLGHLEVAKEYLDQAIVLEPKCRAIALEDPDLDPLQGSLA